MPCFLPYYLLGGGSVALAQSKFKPKYLREDNKAFKDLASNINETGWINFKQGAGNAAINPARFFDTYADALGLDQHYKFKLAKDKTDSKRTRHQHYQLYYKNILVEGADYGLHFRGDNLQTAHGRIPDGLAIDVSKPISEKKALDVALADQLRPGVHLCSVATLPTQLKRFGVYG